MKNSGPNSVIISMRRTLSTPLDPAELEKAPLGAQRNHNRRVSRDIEYIMKNFGPNSVINSMPTSGISMRRTLSTPLDPDELEKAPLGAIHDR